MVCYSTALPNGFVHWDDDWLVTMNPWIRTASWENVAAILDPWGSSKIRADLGAEYLPVRDLSHMVEYRVFRMKAFGYHVSNVLLHMAICLVLYALARRLSGNTPFSLAATLLFAAHPFHVESVAWLAGRKDLLFALFYLLALLTWNRFRGERRTRPRVFFYGATLVLYLLSCTSKTMGVTLPAALLLHDWLFFTHREEGWRRRLVSPLVRTLPFFLVLILYSGLVVVPIGKITLIQDWYGGGFGTTLLSVINVLRSYATEAFLPFKLQTCHDYPLTHGLNVGTVLSAIFLLALSGFGVWVLALSIFRDRAPSPALRLAGFAVLFLFVSISPASNLLFPIGTLYAERYTYLALVGGPLLVAAAFAGLPMSKPRWWPPRLSPYRRPLAFVLLGAVFLFYGVQTFLYNRAWKDGESLWSDVLKKTGGNHHQANYGLGVSLLLKIPGTAPDDLEPMLERAEKHFRIALTQRHEVFFTNAPMVRQALSRILELQGRADEALQEIDAALEENRTLIDDTGSDFVRGERRTARARMLENKIGLLLNRNDPAFFDEAEESALEAVRVVEIEFAKAPNLAQNRNLRGAMYLALGDVRGRGGKDPTEALRRSIADCSHAVLIKEDYREAYESRGIAYAMLSNFVDGSGSDPEMYIRFAIMDFTEAIRLSTEDESEKNRHSRGKAYHGLGDVIGRKGMDPRMYFQMAVEDQDETLRLNPNHPHAHHERGVALSSLGDATAARAEDPFQDFARALQDYRAALDFNPDATISRYNLGLTYIHIGDARAARGAAGTEEYENARRCFERVLEKDPKFWMSLVHLGIALEKLGRISEALAAYEKALVTGEEDYPPLKEALARARKKRKALADPSKIAFSLERAEAAMSRGDLPVARVLFENALRESPHPVEEMPPEFREALARGHYDLARILSLASVGRDARDTPPRPIDPEKRAALRARAVNHLERALELGWDDRDAFKTEADFAPLRDRPAFKALLAPGKRK
jgi:tetratricopeptide (TPR) repeat protein